MNVEWIYDFNSTQSNLEVAGTSFKFSISIINVNHTWTGRVEMPFSLVFRLPYAPPEGPPLACGDPSPLFCKSNTSTWETLASCTFPVSAGPFCFCLPSFADAANGTGTFTIVTTTKDTQFSFSYGFVGSVDGVDILKANLIDLRSVVYFSGIGFDDLIKSYQGSNRTNEIRAPGEDRWMEIIVSFGVHTFNELVRPIFSKRLSPEYSNMLHPSFMIPT